MRRFTSYGPMDTEVHYYVPRKELIQRAYTRLIGENPEKGGHYFTVWAPRQTGKTWTIQQILSPLKKDERFDTLVVNLERLKDEKKVGRVLDTIAGKIGEGLGKKFTRVTTQNKFQEIFKNGVIHKPLILVLDEVDALEETAINTLASAFRSIYIDRSYEMEKNTDQRSYLLHGVALIGVRSVLGIENEKGSPFNVQRSLHIPNLTFDEVKGMFDWFERESGQAVEDAVVQALFEETRGQPGLTCWFGELLTETYNHDLDKPITILNFKEAYGAAAHILPNNTILNIISKVKSPPYDERVIEFFKTDEKIAFKFHDKHINYLYMNGVIDEERAGLEEYYVKFSSPFVQKRLFDYFSNRIFRYMGGLIHPMDEMEDAVTETSLNVPNIIKRYNAYLKQNREVFFKDVPRRKTDLKVYEAVYHFNLYRYLYDLLKPRGVDVVPQFPTGNGKIDLILKYRERVYALELKSFKDIYTFRKGIDQAAQYGRQLGLTEIVYLVFVELNEEEVKKLEQEIERPGIKVIVVPVGVL